MASLWNNSKLLLSEIRSLTITDLHNNPTKLLVYAVTIDGREREIAVSKPKYLRLVVSEVVVGRLEVVGSLVSYSDVLKCNANNILVQGYVHPNNALPITVNNKIKINHGISGMRAKVLTVEDTIDNITVRSGIVAEVVCMKEVNTAVIFGDAYIKGNLYGGAAKSVQATMHGTREGMLNLREKFFYEARKLYPNSRVW